jgi:hypothetical protein
MGTPNVQCTSKLPTAHEPSPPKAPTAPAPTQSTPRAG